MSFKYYWFKIKTKISGDSKENQTKIINESNSESSFVSEWEELKKINRLSQDKRAIVYA